MIREIIAALLAFLTLLLIVVGAAMLTGCVAAKYVECAARDATSRPCN